MHSQFAFPSVYRKKGSEKNRYVAGPDGISGGSPRFMLPVEQYAVDDTRVARCAMTCKPVSLERARSDQR